MSDEQQPNVVNFTPKPSDAEIAADLKVRIETAMGPVLSIMDEALAHGMLVQWDGLAPMGFPLRNKINNLRIVKVY